MIWQKPHKSLWFGQNGLILTKAAQNCLFLPICLSFGKSYSKLCFLTEIALVWQKYTEQLSQIGKLVQKNQDGKPVQKNQNGKFLRMREIDEFE